MFELELDQGYLIFISIIFSFPDGGAPGRAASGQSISTSPPGGNQVDGLPPVFSNLVDLGLFEF